MNTKFVVAGIFSCLLANVSISYAQNAVGIGDVSFTPNYLLHLNQNAASGTLFQLSNTSTGSATTDGLLLTLNGNNVELNNQENADIRFFTNNAERVRITNTGDVGIGVTPVQKLDVGGNIRFTGALMPNGNGGATGQLLISQGAGVAPSWSNANSVVQVFADLQGAVNTAYTNNTVTFTNSLIANSFNLSVPGYYVFEIYIGIADATSAVGMNFRLQNMTSVTTIDGPYFSQFPDPNGFGDFGGSVNVKLLYNKTTTTSETLQVQWAASVAGGTTGSLSIAGARTSRIVVLRYPN